MDAEARREMLRRDREEWSALVARLDAQPSGPRHDPESPRWEARDVYAHFARWMNNSMDAFAAWRDGRQAIPPPEGSDDEINARWQAADAVLSFAEAREQAQRAFERRFAAIEAVLEDGWDPILDEVARADGYRHYAAHLSYLRTPRTPDLARSRRRAR